MHESFSSSIRFEPFELNLSTGELFRAGQPIKLQPQPFKVLAFLAERPGALVTREQLQQELWGSDTFVDFDHGLNFAIKKIREALRDNPERPRYIETLPRRGYRFIAPVDRISSPPLARSQTPRVVPISAALDQPTSEHDSTLRSSDSLARAPRPQPRPDDDLLGPTRAESGVPAEVERPNAVRRIWPKPVLLVAALVVSIAALVTLWATVNHAPRPVIGAAMQLTHYGHVDPPTILATDGSRIYFTERAGGHWGLAQVSVEGGEASLFPVTLPNVFLRGINATGTKLLISDSGGPSSEESFFVVPSGGGSPRPLDGVVGVSAAWSPDDSKIAFTSGKSIYEVDLAGGEKRKIADLSDNPWYLRWSPSGGILRFSETDSRTGQFTIWQMNADGTGSPSPVPLGFSPGTSDSEGECCGEWARDGRYYIFLSIRQTGRAFWALPASSRFGIEPPSPVSFYSSADTISNPLPSRDGKKIFFVSFRERRELVSYNANLNQFVSYLGGLAARYVNFSPDGQWVTYQGASDGALWRSRSDGSDKMQLTFPPSIVTFAAYSPDGRQIAFSSFRPGYGHIFLISRDGGSQQTLASGEAYDRDPTWSPDGAQILFDRSPSAENWALGASSVYLVDLKTQVVSKIPGSDGFTYPRWSPDGRYAIALSVDKRDLMLYEFSAQKWSALAHGEGLYGAEWTRDSKSVYYQDLFDGVEQPVYRVVLAGKKIERVATSAQILRGDVLAYTLTGITPDGAPLASLNHSTSDIYSLDLDLR